MRLNRDLSTSKRVFLPSGGTIGGQQQGNWSSSSQGKKKGRGLRREEYNSNQKDDQSKGDAGREPVGIGIVMCACNVKPAYEYKEY